jgi:hypothetical protein
MPPAPRHTPVSAGAYTAQASFGLTTGRFAQPGVTSRDQYFTDKGIPTNRDERMMAHYFDESNWQDKRNAIEAAKQKKLAKRQRRY